MIEKRFELGNEQKMVESLSTKLEIQELVRVACSLNAGESTGYEKLGEWEVREGVRWYTNDTKPSGFKVTDADALYCDIEKNEKNFDLYFSEPGTIFKIPPNISTNTLSVKELQKCLTDTLNEAKKTMREKYGIVEKKAIDLTPDVKKSTSKGMFI